MPKVEEHALEFDPGVGSRIFRERYDTAMRASKERQRIREERAQAAALHQAQHLRGCSIGPGCAGDCTCKRNATLILHAYFVALRGGFLPDQPQAMKDQTISAEDKQ